MSGTQLMVGSLTVSPQPRAFIFKTVRNESSNKNLITKNRGWDCSSSILIPPLYGGVRGGSLFLVCIRLIRPIRGRFTSERNYHNYHNYPRNNLFTFYLTQIAQSPQIFYSHAETQSPRRELAFIIRMRVIRVRFTSERNYHNYHNYSRNTIWYGIHSLFRILCLIPNDFFFLTIYLTLLFHAALSAA